MSGSKKEFGTVDQLPSGRYRARWRQAGKRVSAPTTFETEQKAWVYLGAKRAELDALPVLARGHRRVTFGDYAEQWLAHKSLDWAINTREKSRNVVRLYLIPTFGAMDLDEITVPDVKEWQADMRQRLSQSTTAESYRIGRQIFRDAREDGVTNNEPFRIRGAGTARPPERPTATAEEINALANAIRRPFHLWVLLTGFCALRPQEIGALNIQDIDLEAGTVTINKAMATQVPKDGTKLPKTASGERIIGLPSAILDGLRVHIKARQAIGSAPLFVTQYGTRTAGAALDNAWREGVREAVWPNGHPSGKTFTYYDLRGSALTLAEQTGYSRRDIQTMAGHGDARSTERYLHAQASTVIAIGQNMPARLPQ